MDRGTYLPAELADDPHLGKTSENAGHKLGITLAKAPGPNLIPAPPPSH